MLTPKALANFQPRVGASATTLGPLQYNGITLKGFANYRTLSGFHCSSNRDPGLSLRSNPGLKLANAFGVSQTGPVRITVLKPKSDLSTINKVHERRQSSSCTESCRYVVPESIGEQLMKAACRPCPAVEKSRL